MGIYVMPFACWITFSLVLHLRVDCELKFNNQICDSLHLQMVFIFIPPFFLIFINSVFFSFCYMLSPYILLHLQVAFVGFIYPCLVLQYMGQAAFISKNFSYLPISFYESIPSKRCFFQAHSIEVMITPICLHLLFYSLQIPCSGLFLLLPLLLP